MLISSILLQATLQWLSEPTHAMCVGPSSDATRAGKGALICFSTYFRSGKTLLVSRNACAVGCLLVIVKGANPADGVFNLKPYAFFVSRSVVEGSGISCDALVLYVRCYGPRFFCWGFVFSFDGNGAIISAVAVMTAACVVSSLGCVLWVRSTSDSEV
jgi:hypothetical protein